MRTGQAAKAPPSIFRSHEAYLLFPSQSIGAGTMGPLACPVQSYTDGLQVSRAGDDPVPEIRDVSQASQVISPSERAYTCLFLSFPFCPATGLCPLSFAYCGR